VFAELLGDTTALGGDEVLEVGLGSVAGDVHTLQQQGQPGLHLPIHGITLPMVLSTHLQHRVQEGKALSNIHKYAYCLMRGFQSS